MGQKVKYLASDYVCSYWENGAAVLILVEQQYGCEKLGIRRWKNDIKHWTNICLKESTGVCYKGNKVNGTRKT